jgi:hypothetical protein
MVTAANPPMARPRYDLADFSIALITGLFLAMIALSLVTVPLAGKMVGFRDFVAYYATGPSLSITPTLTTRKPSAALKTRPDSRSRACS